MPWKQLFAIRSFRLLFLAQLISSFGDVIHSLALMWFVYGTTGSALKTGGVATMTVIAKLLFGLPAGALVDRWNRKTIMLVSDLLRGAVVLSLVVVAWTTGGLPLWYIYAATFVLSLSGMLFGPARNAVLPDIVGSDLLLSANVAANMVGQLLMIGYTAVGGILVALIGPIWALTIDALTFFVSAGWVLLAHIPDTRELAGKAKLSLRALASEIKEGLAFMRSQSLIAFVVSVVILVNFGSGLYSALTPVLVQSVLKSGAAVYGLISTAMVVGSVAGSIVLESIFQRFRPSTLVFIGLGGSGLCTVLLGFVSSVPLALLLFGVMSFALVFNQMPLYTTLQRETPGHLRGRVFNIFGVLANISSPLAIGIGAWLADSFGVSYVYLLGGAIILLGAWITLQRSQLLNPINQPSQERLHEPSQPLAATSD